MRSRIMDNLVVNICEISMGLASYQNKISFLISALLRKLRICLLHHLQQDKISHTHTHSFERKKGDVLGMAQNCIWWWDFISGALGSMESIICYHPRLALIQSGSTHRVPFMSQIDSFESYLYWTGILETI